jgi:glutamyl-tRNA synthetase
LEFHNEKDGTVSSGYRESGYFPEAVINFLALLGWHTTGDQEIFSMDELIQQFSLDRVSKSGAKFDYEKGKWFNHQYLQLKSNEELAELFMPVLEKKVSTVNYQLSTIAHIVSLVKDRVNFVPELWEQTNFFFAAPTEYDEKSLAKRWKEDSPRHMTELLEVLEKVSEADWSANYPATDDKGNQVTRWKLDDIVMPWIADHEYGVGIVMNAFRICLFGAARGPHIWAITDVIGKEETLKRVKTALERLK